MDPAGFGLADLLDDNIKYCNMKRISEVEEKPFTSSLNISPEACCGADEVNVILLHVASEVVF